MCFTKKPPHRTDLQAKYDEDEGTVIDETNPSSDHVNIPNDIPEHVDNIDCDIDDGILVFIYETKDKVITVWKNEEACAKDFTESCSLNSEID